MSYPTEIDRDAEARPATGLTADIVVNYTGLLAARLGGVEDNSLIPERGQLVIVENESHGLFSFTGDEDMHKDVGECCYIIERPGGSSPDPIRGTLF